MSHSFLRALWRSVAPLLDAAVVWGAILGAWSVLRHSPFAAPHAPHWARERYILGGALLAAAYVLLSMAAGLYGARCATPRERVPLLNFATFLLLFVISILAALRYAAWMEDELLFSRRVIGAAFVLAYFVTSVHHYVRLNVRHASNQESENR